MTFPGLYVPIFSIKILFDNFSIFSNWGCLRTCTLNEIKIRVEIETFF